MHRLFSGSIHKTLTFLVCLAILPAMLILFISGRAERNHDIETAQKEVLFLAATIAEAQKGIIRSTQQILLTLSQMTEIQNLDGPAASRIFKSLIENNSPYINIIAIDLNGDVFASARPFDPVNLADRPHFQQAVAQKKFVVGHFIITRVGHNRPSLAFACPVLDDQNQVKAILGASLHLEGLAEFYGIKQLPDNSFIAVTDSNGIRIFYHPSKDLTHPIGDPIVTTAWDRIKTARTPGFSVHAGSDGIRRFSAYHPISEGTDQVPYMYVWAGIPESAILLPAEISLAINLGLMGLAGLLALGISWLVGRRILILPIRQLVSTTEAFAKGYPGARTGLAYNDGEVGALAKAFDHMADNLAKHQEDLRSIADYTYDWEYWIDPDHNLVWMSPSSEQITGYRPEAFLADPSLLSRIVYEPDRPIFESHVRNQESIQEQKNDVDFRIQTLSDKIIWINHHCLPIYRSDGSFLGRRISNRDITDRKAVEQALEESETQFRSLVEGAPDAIFVQTDHCFSYVNDAAIHLFGADRTDQLLGKPVVARFHPDCLEAINSRINQLNQGRKKAPRMEQTALRMDNTPVSVETTAVPITFEGKNGALVFVQDITERKQIEVRLQQAQKMEAIGALAGGIAHDFNNILFPIIGLSEMLLEDLPKDSPEHDNIIEIHRAARRAGDLVNQILSFSRQSEHKKIPLRIQQVLKEVSKLTRSTIPSNIEFHITLQKDCAPVLADPTNIHQIAMNLITNAYHAVEHNNGSIAVDLKQVQIDAQECPDLDIHPGTYARMTVSDSGTGIPAEILPDIFNPYFTTKPQGKGTGLGLSVVFGIVKEHGGDIRVYSEVDKGTVFKVYLPTIQKDSLPETPEPAVIYPTGSERILLVDDEEQVVRMEKQMLERLGYQVTIRTSSVEALQAFKAAPTAYDLVITDMAMPNMTGDQLARHLIAIRKTIPVVICTGFSEQITMSRAKEMGIKGFLMKPVVRSELASMIRTVLDQTDEAT